MDPVTLFIVAVVSVAVGYITGILIGRTGRKQSKAPNDPAVSSPSPTPSADGEAAATQVDLVHFFRTQPDAPLTVRMGSHQWENATQVPDTELVTLQSLAAEFQGWLKPLQPPAPTPLPAAESQDGTIAPPPEPVHPVIVTTPTMAPPAPPANKPTFIEPKTIVAQIDEILQETLTASPLADRKIRLVEVPNQGVVVQVGQEQFPGIDAVPDPEVRNLIRQAVSTWETRAV